MRKLLILITVSLVLCGCSQDERIGKLSTELRRMSSDTETGMNYATYGDTMRDLNFALSEVQDNELGSQDYRNAVGNSVRHYDAAHAAWRVKVETGEEYLHRLKSGGYRITRSKATAANSVDVIEAVSGLELTSKKVSIDEVIQLNWNKANDFAKKAAELE